MGVTKGCKVREKSAMEFFGIVHMMGKEMWRTMQQQGDSIIWVGQW